MTDSLKGELQRITDLSGAVLKESTDLGKDIIKEGEGILKEGEDIGKGIKEGFEGLFKKKD